MSQRPTSQASVLILLLALSASSALGDDTPLNLTLRGRDKVAPGSSLYEVVEHDASWDSRKTALIVIDVWDKHWCEGANRRVAVMAPRFAAFVNACRDRGV